VSLLEAAQSFGLGTPIGGAAEVARGATGRVFRVETATGVWAVKELFVHAPGVSEQQLEQQASFVEAAGEAGVAAPRIVRSVDGGVVALVDGVRWRVFGWVDVAGPSSLRQAGATLARLHAAGWPTADDVEPRYRDRTVGGSWAEILDRARDRPWAPLLREQVPEIEALEALAREAPVPPCRMCHRDFNEANVVVDRAGRVVVLDWEDCGPLPPAWEVGYVLLNGGRGHWRNDTAAGIRDLVTAYRRAGGVFEPRGVAVFSAVLAAHYNYLAQAIDAALAGDRWAQESVEAIVAHPIRVASLRQILDAVP
jgi:Ser/Thr protein kinase RdoA (MazF antagonist)